MLQYDRSEIVSDIKNIAEEVDNELSKEVIDKGKVTKLMCKQLMRGLYLQHSK